MTDYPLERLRESLRAALDEVEELSKPAPSMPPMELRKIQFSVGVAWDVSENDLLSRRRFPTIVLPRFAGYHLSKERTSLSFTVIGNSFRKDHTTIIHGIKKAEILLKESPDFKKKYNLCLSILNRFDYHAGKSLKREHQGLT